MRLTTTFMLLLGLGIGCADKAQEATEATDTGSPGDADGWWEDDSSDDDDKPDDDDDKPDDSFILFEFGISMITGEGGFEGHWGACNFSGDLASVTEVEACDDCTMAMSMTIESVVFTGEDCEELADLEGSEEQFGHGAVELIEIDGLSIHGLYSFNEEEDETWAVVEDGYSLFWDDMWFFGIEQG